MPVEDALAFFREAIDFRNVRLVEVDERRLRHTIARLLLFATVRLAAFERLSDALATRCWQRSRPRASRS